MPHTDWFIAPPQTIDPALVTFAAATTGSPTEGDFDDARNSPTGSPASTGVAAVRASALPDYYVSQDKLAIRWTPLASLFVPYVDMTLAPPDAIGVEIELAGTGVPEDDPFVNWPNSLGWITSAQAVIDYDFDTANVGHIETNSVDAFVHTNGLTFGGDGSPPAELDQWFVGDSFLGTFAHPTPFTGGIRDTVALPVGTDTAELTVPLGSADIGVNFALTDRDAWSLIVLTSRNAWSGEIPGGSPTPSGLQLLGDGTAHVTVHYQPPRFRFVLPGRPPLAHRQRRDGVATVGPPLAHLQGGTGALRPDVAHRQQTP